MKRFLGKVSEALPGVSPSIASWGESLKPCSGHMKHLMLMHIEFCHGRRNHCEPLIIYMRTYLIVNVFTFQV